MANQWGGPSKSGWEPPPGSRSKSGRKTALISLLLSALLGATVVFSIVSLRKRSNKVQTKEEQSLAEQASREELRSLLQKYMDTGQGDRALRLLRNALEREPENTVLQEELERLLQEQQKADRKALDQNSEGSAGRNGGQTGNSLGESREDTGDTGDPAEEGNAAAQSLEMAASDDGADSRNAASSRSPAQIAAASSAQRSGTQQEQKAQERKAQEQKIQEQKIQEQKIQTMPEEGGQALGPSKQAYAQGTNPQLSTAQRSNKLGDSIREGQDAESKAAEVLKLESSSAPAKTLQSQAQAQVRAARQQRSGLQQKADRKALDQNSEGSAGRNGGQTGNSLGKSREDTGDTGDPAEEGNAAAQSLEMAASDDGADSRNAASSRSPAQIAAASSAQRSGTQQEQKAQERKAQEQKAQEQKIQEQKIQTMPEEGGQALGPSKQAYAQGTNPQLSTTQRSNKLGDSIREGQDAESKAAEVLKLESSSAPAKTLQSQAQAQVRAARQQRSGLQQKADRKALDQNSEGSAGRNGGQTGNSLGESREDTGDTGDPAEEGNAAAQSLGMAASDDGADSRNAASSRSPAQIAAASSAQRSGTQQEQKAQERKAQERKAQEQKAQEQKIQEQKIQTMPEEGGQALGPSKQAYAQGTNPQLSTAQRSNQLGDSIREGQDAESKAAEVLKLESSSAPAKTLQSQAQAQVRAARQQRSSLQQEQARQQADQAGELAELHRQLSQARERGDGPAIDKLVTEILAKDAQDSPAHTARAKRIEETQGTTALQALKAAEGSYRKALARDPAQDEVQKLAQEESLAGLARNLDHQNRLPEAIKAYDAALAQPVEPFDSELAYLRGIALYRQGRYQEAAASFNEYINGGGQNLRAYYALGLSYTRLQRPSQAIETYQQAISKGFEHAPSYWELAKLKLEQGQARQALDDVNMALSLKSGDGRYLQTRGEALFQLERYNEAALAYEQAGELVAQKPEKAQINYNKALSYYNNAEYYRAEQAFEQALLLDQSRPEYMLGLADAQLAGDRPQAAGQTLAEAARKFPDNVDVLLTQGNAYLKQEQYEEALPVFHAAHQKDPQNRKIINNLGLAYLSTQRYDQSREFFRKAIAADSKNSVLWFNLALVDVATEEHEDAIQHLERTLALDDKMSDAYYLLSKEYLVTKRHKQAKQTLARLRRIDPDYSKIAELEELLGE